MDSKYGAGSVVLHNWTLVRKIGEGSFGRVFEAQRKDYGQTYRAAIKIISIPQNESELKSVQADSMDDESVSTYFRGFVEELAAEFALMSQIKGHSNIVSYEDHAVVPHDDTIGWDIIIRMELLTPLIDHVKASPMTQADVIRLGVDLCKALELCQRHNIIHRDIKPENIFVAENGDFKLGDFGIARTVEKTSSGMSKKGTYSYMAPEVYKEEPYGAGVDIYSLGLVLYWLLNDRRTPFLPAVPAPITPADRDSALRRRIKGEAIPAPKNVDAPMAEIILKACAYDPKARYSTPLEMRQALEALAAHGEFADAPAVSATAEVDTPDRPAEKTALIGAVGDTETDPTEKIKRPPAADLDDKTEIIPAPPAPANKGTESGPRKRPKAVLWAGLAVGALAVVVIAAILLFKPGDDPGGDAETPSPTPSENAVETDAPDDPYRDVAGTLTDWNTVEHKDAVALMVDLGIINGMPDGSFAPTSNIDRASWAKMVYFAATGSDNADAYLGTQTSLKDIAGNWAESYISFLAANKYVSGDDVGNFNPSNNVTVAEACKTMLTVLGYDANDRGYQNSDAWSGNIMNDAKRIGLMDNVDRAQTALVPLTRENAAEIVYNALNANMVVPEPQWDGGVKYIVNYQTLGPLVSEVFGDENQLSLPALPKATQAPPDEVITLPPAPSAAPSPVATPVETSELDSEVSDAVISVYDQPYGQGIYSGEWKDDSPMEKGNGIRKREHL